MPQDRDTGAAAAAWGRETAKHIAAALGATAPTGGSNECTLTGQRIVIKCAATDTDSVGVTFKMLDRIAKILGAFQEAPDTFRVWAITSAQFKANMRDTASRGASAGKVGLVRRSFFEQHGAFVKTIRL